MGFRPKALGSIRAEEFRSSWCGALGNFFQNSTPTQGRRAHAKSKLYSRAVRAVIQVAKEESSAD